MLTTMIVDENIRLKGFNLIVSETEFLILSIALSRMADSKYVNDKDRVIAERMHNDLYEVGADMAGVPQTDLVQDSPNLVKDLVEDYEPYEYEIKAWHKEHQEPYCEIADTPQTDLLVKTSSISRDSHEKADTPQTECDTCRHYKPACELFSEICKYEPTTQTETENSNLTFDTPQTERPSCKTCRYYSEEEYSDKCDECVIEVGKRSNYEPQTDCPWK